MNSSSQNWCHTFLFFFLFTVLISTTPISSSTISYSDHCSSIVPESSPTNLERTTYPLLPKATTHYTGGDKILGKNFSEKSFSFRTTRNVYKTKADGVYKIEAYLTFRPSNAYDLAEDSIYGRSRTSPRLGLLKFLLKGFWSESSRKLCMVGSASWHSTEGILKLDSVLKLNYAKNSTIFTSLVTGTLESLSSPNDPSFFEPISILAFPPMANYKYTLVSEEFDRGCSGGIDIPPDSSLSLEPRGICTMLPRRYDTFELEYASKCNSSQNCAPFGGGIGYLPQFMSLYAIRCSEDEKKLRYLVEFSNSGYVWYDQRFDPNTTLVGEGSWDEKKNRLCIVACRILSPTDSLGNANIGDCSTRLSLRYPAVWSIRNSTSMVGQIWTNKTANEPGYFDRIKFQSHENRIMGGPDLRYEYTELDTVRKSCPTRKPVKKKGEIYPNEHSYDMRFDISFKDSQGNFGWGYAVPNFVGDHLYEQSDTIISSSEQGYFEIDEAPAGEANTSNSGPLKISYMIRLTLQSQAKLGGAFNLSSSPNGPVVISAEGFYDAETGQLCMVGCKRLGSGVQKSTNISVDCEILVNFKFPPVNGKGGGVIKGSVESTRKNTDSLFFEHFNMSATAFYTSGAKQSIWRMDLEITMVLISNTLACVFVALQLFYVKKHPEVLPFISLVMLVILTLGHMIPLVLNFEALFLEYHSRQNAMLRSGGWLEANEVIVRVATMVAFLLQFRLLQLAWTARLGDGNEKGLWVAEKKALFVSLPLYFLGGLIALFLNWNKNKLGGNARLSSGVDVYQQHSLWGDLRIYSGLVVDGFLFPQILVNIFQISKENALSRSFYIGTTLVRLLPHAYDLYRAHNYVPRDFYERYSYIYANSGADFYSTAWDVIIPCGGMIFAVIIYLQQRYGGRYVLPRRFRGLELYQKVPVISSE